MKQEKPKEKIIKVEALLEVMAKVMNELEEAKLTNTEVEFVLTKLLNVVKTTNKQRLYKATKKHLGDMVTEKEAFKMVT